jgi:ankyrin repeat protein
MLASVADINVRSADGSTALHVACGAGQEDAAMLLLLQGADPRAADNQGTTALERAAASGSERLVAVLLQRGAAPEARLRAWFAACDAKQLGVVLFFLQNGADVNAAGGDGRTAFHRSCTGLPDESAIALLAHAKEAGVELQGVTKALQEAVMFSSKRLVLALLDLGADMYGVTSHEHSAWHLAAQLGLTKKLQLFLDAGAQVDACKQGSSATALQLASTWGQADAARLLLQAGADVNAVAADGTPLHAAVRYKRLGVVSVLLAHGADMLSVPDCGRCMLSPWLLAAQVGSAGIIKLMLEHGAPVNTADASGVTALHIACQTAQAEAVALLLAAGADPQAATADGSTALHLTACTSCVQALLAAGADVHAVMHDGSTPLLCAAGRQDKPVLQCLLEAGANPTASHNTGWTPLHVAITGLWTEGLQLLLGAARNNVGGRSRSSSSSSSSSSSETCESKGGSAAHVPTAVSARNTSAGIQDFLDAVTADGVTPLHMAIDQVLAHWVPPNAEREAPYHPIGCQLALQIALLLLAEGAGVQTVTADGSTMLHLAACSRCVQLVEELLARGADVNAVAADGSTPLLYAVLCGEAAVVECLLRSGANPFTPCAEGWTALHAAASMVWYDGVWLLIEGADSWVFSRSSSCGGDSNLIGGAAGATPADAELQGFLDARTATGQTALHLVAVRDGPLSKAAAAAGVSSWRRDHWHGGERDVATLLLEAGANVDAVSDDGSTPLMCSVMSRDGALQSCLLTWGADPTAARKDGWTALHIAATCETSNRVQWLVEAVRSCDDSDSIVCSTAGRPLGAVAASPMMQDFLHARTASGHTALHLALANYHVGELIVLELLQAGASIDVLRGDPWWPQGADDKCPDGGKMVYALDRVSEFGPDPDVPWPPIAPKGTLLHWAVRQDWSVHLVELLVSLGADTAAVNAEGETPWHVLYKQAANEHTQQVGTLLATAACIDHTAHGQTLPGLVAHGKESLLCHSIKAVAGTLAAPGTVPQQLLAATCCKDVAQAAQLIRQGLAQCSRAASQQQVSAASCCPATRHQQLQQHSQPQQQQQPPPVMATQQVALEHATRVAVARSTAAAAAFLGGLVEVLGMQGCVSLLHRMLPACTHGGKARAGQAPATEDKEGPVAAARLLQEELFVQRLALAVLQAWLPEQRLRHDHTCRLQQLVPAARSASDCTLGTSCLVIDRSHPEWDLDDPDREDPPEEDLAFETAMRWVEDGRVADAGSQLVCLAEQGVDCAARLIRRKLSYSNSIGHLMICHALVAAWEVGHRKWLQALREAVVAAVRAS